MPAYGTPPNPTEQFRTDQMPTSPYTSQQPPYTGQQPPPTAQWSQHTPPYGVPLSQQGPQGPEGPGAPPPQRHRGKLWPWLVAAVAILVIVIGGATLFYFQTLGSDSEAAPRPTRSIAPVTTTTSAPPTTSFSPRFVSISGTVESNDGSTLVVRPEDGGANVTVITDADTQVLLGGDEGVASFQPGDTVFVQGGEQQDGRVLARMIIGSLFGG